ncbi:MAG: hypothetical protein LBQ69_04745 [Treponema sp.]|jgi:uncharacterized integral membrane protein|nr:hypothetical protein [Treponema sp.]
MPWRLIQFIVIFVLFFFFIMFNLQNKCDISFGFTAIKDLPVFVTAFSSFIIGLLCALPLAIGRKLREKGGKPPKAGKPGKKPGKPDGDFSASSGQYGIN